MKKILFIILLASPFANKIIAQIPRNQLLTDVYVLNACSPTQVAIYVDSGVIRYKSSNKLSLNVNRLSAFKIKNINPLRYTYYVDNKYVSQFFDQEDMLSGGNTKYNNDLNATDISILEVFKADKNTITAREKIEDSKRRIQLLKDSLQILNGESWELDRRVYYLAKDGKIKKDSFDIRVIAPKGKENATLVKDLETERKKIDNKYAEQYQQLENELEVYNGVIEGLTINGKIENIIDDIANMAIDSSNKSLLIYEKKNSDEASTAKVTIQDLDELNRQAYEILTGLNGVYGGTATTAQIDALAKMANAQGYAINRQLLLGYEDNYKKKIEIYKLKEFAANKKINTIESFIVFASLEIGKLLEGQIVFNSRFQNMLSQQTCIDSLRDSLNKVNMNGTLVYNYIQNISANLNVLIKYLELDNPAFNSTVKNINDNYNTLLKSTKVFDFVDKNNTKIFTHPSHTNLKNVDLVRYSIERKDKLTGSVEPYTYDLWIKGGFKIDFSVAILMSQLSDFTYNKSALFISEIDSSGNSKISQSSDSFYIQKVDKGNYDFAFGGMVNIMWRTGAYWLTPGASIGIAYSANQKLQFLGAISLQFGKTERIIAHFGLSGGLAQRLDVSQLTYDTKNDVLENGTKYKVKGDMATLPVPYTNKFMFKPFFGISYNLSKKNALNAVGKGNDAYKAAFTE